MASPSASAANQPCFVTESVSAEPIAAASSHPPIASVLVVVAASAFAMVMMQYAILSHTDIETLLRLKAAGGALTAAEVDALVARQIAELRYAPLLSLLVWPFCVALGATVFSAALRAIGGQRFAIARTLPAFVVGIAFAYLLYALIGTVAAIAFGTVALPNSVDVLLGELPIALKTMLQTFDLANLTALLIAGGLILSTMHADRHAAAAAFVIAAAAVLVGYAAAKGALIALTAPADKPIVCELCKLAASHARDTTPTGSARP